MKNKKNIIMIVMLVAIALMSMGYALFATQLNINSIGNITSQWNVYFESISNGTAVGGASNVVAPSVTGTSANMNVNLNLPGDSMTYSLVLKNGGTVPAIIEDIDAKAEGSTGIIYSISGLNIGDKLSGGASKTITIKIEYDPNTSSQPVETYKKLTVTIDAVQDIGQSITTQTPAIEGELGTLARAILNNNQVQSDEYIDFSKGSSYITSYKEVHAESTESVSMSSSSTYYFGSGYTFDKSTGLYTLTGTTTGTWSTMSTNYKNYPYTCKSSSASCWYSLYKMTGYTSTTAGVGYEYTRTKVYNDNGKGLYYTSTNTEDGKTTYYFRGNVENNYVSFGTYSSDLLVDRYYGDAVKLANAGEEIIWRIVRINEDGSIRLISHMPVYGNIPYGDTINFGQSSVKTKLEEWYTSNLSAHSSLLADAGFCNEIVESQEYIEPQFKCSTPNNLYTLSTSDKGNKGLTSPIGLLTLSEVMYGGFVGSYLNFNSAHSSIDYRNDSCRTMTARHDSAIIIWGSESTVNLSPEYAYWEEDIFVRPVINLKADIKITGGNGTAGNPYVIATN